mgnify:CR=1 FL=1
MDFSTLLGKVLVSIRGGVDDAELIFITSTGTQYKLYHEQDCCETVYIEDIVLVDMLYMLRRLTFC